MKNDSTSIPKIASIVSLENTLKFTISIPIGIGFLLRFTAHIHREMVWVLENDLGAEIYSNWNTMEKWCAVNVFDLRPFSMDTIAAIENTRWCSVRHLKMEINFLEKWFIPAALERVFIRCLRSGILTPLPFDLISRRFSMERRINYVFNHQNVKVFSYTHTHTHCCNMNSLLRIDISNAVYGQILKRI